MDIAPFIEVRVAQRFGAPSDRVFDAWIDPEIAGLWLFATASRPAARVKIDARAGGSFCFVERRGGADMAHAGEYVEIARPRRLVFTLSEQKSRVSIEIVPLDTGCELTLVQEKALPDQASRIEGRWSGMLYGLGKMLSRSSRRINPGNGRD